VLAALGTGIALTAKGRAERDRWVAYAAALRSGDTFSGAGAADVGRLGEQLAYAAALGAAPAAADALSPRGGV
jgi:hypothetical protein